MFDYFYLKSIDFFSCALAAAFLFIFMSLLSALDIELVELLLDPLVLDPRALVAVEVGGLGMSNFGAVLYLAAASCSDFPLRFAASPASPLRGLVEESLDTVLDWKRKQMQIQGGFIMIQLNSSETLTRHL